VYSPILEQAENLYSTQKNVNHISGSHPAPLSTPMSYCSLRSDTMPATKRAFFIYLISRLGETDIIRELGHCRVRVVSHRASWQRGPVAMQLLQRSLLGATPEDIRLVSSLRPPPVAGRHRTMTLCRAASRFPHSENFSRGELSHRRRPMLQLPEPTAKFARPGDSDTAPLDSRGREPLRQAVRRDSGASTTPGVAGATLDAEKLDECNNMKILNSELRAAFTAMTSVCNCNHPATPPPSARAHT
jgi:hypothetical protein